MKLITILCSLTLITVFTACGEDQNADHGHAHEHTSVGHEHGEHSGHDHGESASHQDHGHGTEHTLGTLQIGSDDSFTISQFGSISAGGEAVISVVVSSSSAQEIRAWIGEENGRGSVKSLITLKDNAFHGHVEVPAKISDSAKLWIEFTNSADAQVSGSIAFEQ